MRRALRALIVASLVAGAPSAIALAASPTPHHPTGTRGRVVALAT
jgi:hypothetical protein